MTTSQQNIVVHISQDGTITAETRGIKGTECLDYIAVLEDLLDAQTHTSAFTHEYNETTTSINDEVRNDLHTR